jgi:hypothetical protein
MMDFDLRAKGPMKSLSSADAIRALNGTVNLDFSPLKVAGFDAAYELGRLGDFASSMTDNSATDIVRLAGRILVKNGIAETEDLRANLAIGNFSASGTADLATEILNLKLSAVFTKEFSDKAAATRAGEFMQSVLSNGNGELVIPAIVTGSFKAPKFAPDLQAIARMQKQRFLPTLQNPGAAIRDLLGLRGAKPEDGGPPPAEPQPPSRIRGILDLLGGKKNTNEQK